MNHPNRSKGPKGPFANPSPEEIKAARLSVGLSQAEAGTLVRSSLRSWQQWEAGDNRMHPGLWELFRLKVGLPT